MKRFIFTGICVLLLSVLVAQTPLLLPIYEGEDTIVFYDEHFEEVFQTETLTILHGAFEKDHVICRSKIHRKSYRMYDNQGNLLFKDGLINGIKAMPMSNSLYQVIIDNVDRRGYIKKPDYAYLARSYWLDKYGKRQTQLDSIIIPSRFTEGYSFYRDNLRPGKFGLVNIKGEKITSCIFGRGYYFSEGLCPIFQKEKEEDIGKWVYIDTLGNEVIPVPDSLHHPEPFFYGRAKVRFSVDRNRYMGMTGQEYSYKSYGFIDKTGVVAIKNKYASATHFINNIAIVEYNNIDSMGRFGGIDTLGNTIIPFEYSKLQPFAYDMAAATPCGEKYQIIINKDNEILYESQENRTLRPVGEHIIMEEVEAGKPYYRYINLKTGAILQSNYAQKNPLPVER